MAGVAKVRGSKAKEHRHRATVAALVLEKVGAVFRAHFGSGDVAATAAHQLGGVKGLGSQLRVASRLTAVVGLLALVANVIGVTIHRVSRWVLIVAPANCRDRFSPEKSQSLVKFTQQNTSRPKIKRNSLVQTLVLESHQCFPLDVLVEFHDCRQLVEQGGVLHGNLADRTQGESKGDPRANPLLRQHVLAAVQVKHVSALQLNGRRARQCLGEANHAHVVGVLLEIGVWYAIVEAGQAWLFVFHAAAQMTAGVDFAAGIFRVLLTIVIRADVANGQQARIPGGSAEATNTCCTNCLLRRSIAKLHEGFERPAVGERQYPEQLCAPATLVQVNANCLLLLLAHLAHVHPRSTVQVQHLVALGAQIAALVALDDGCRLAVVVIAAYGLLKGI